MESRQLLFLMALVLFSSEVFAQSNSPDATKTIGIGENAPEWTLKGPEGSSYSLDDYKGKILILDFWATWCGPCRKEMPRLQEIHEQYSNNDVAVIAISTWENGDPQKYMAEHKYTYQLLVEGEKIAKYYNVNGLPTLYIINQEGEIIYSKVGMKYGATDGGFQEIIETIENTL